LELSFQISYELILLVLLCWYLELLSVVEVGVVVSYFVSLLGAESSENICDFLIQLLPCGLAVLSLQRLNSFAIQILVISCRLFVFQNIIAAINWGLDYFLLLRLLGLEWFLKISGLGLRLNFLSFLF
tara:strand:- start:803 stop:1186 length:384 start_codon:yes stop_codon:yes gene_type:complete